MYKKKQEAFVWFYNEVVIQFGFIAFFAFVFPAAPLFVFILNFLEINVKLDSLTKYSKRDVAEGANGIGSWLPVMEFISHISIPINVAMVFWTGYKNQPSLVVQYL